MGMQGYHEVNLAWEYIEMLDYLTPEEAKNEILVLLECDYEKEIDEEVDEEIDYDFEDALTDVLDSIINLAETYIRNTQTC